MIWLGIEHAPTSAQLPATALQSGEQRSFAGKRDRAPRPAPREPAWRLNALTRNRAEAELGATAQRAP